MTSLFSDRFFPSHHPIINHLSRASWTKSLLQPIQSTIDVNGRLDRLELCAQLFLDAVQVEAVIVCDKIDAQARVTKAAKAANAVQVGLGVLGEIEIDHHVHTLDVNASGKKVWRDQTLARSGPDARMDEEAWEAKLCNLLGKQLHRRHGVAENDSLLDLQLGK